MSCCCGRMKRDVWMVVVVIVEGAESNVRSFRRGSYFLKYLFPTVLKGVVMS
jgi:hypothetical protein